MCCNKSLSDLVAERTFANKKCFNGLDSNKRIKKAVDSITAKNEQQLVFKTELPRSSLPIKLPTPPQSHINTPLVSNRRSVFEKYLTMNALFKLTTN